MQWEEEWGNDGIRLENSLAEVRVYLCNCVRMGDLERVRQMQEDEMICEQLMEASSFSANQLRNARYHIASALGAISLACMEGGMDAETAHRLGNKYISQMDLIHDIEGLRRLNQKAALDFTKRMMDIRKQKVYSKNIVQCIDYIYKHIGDRVTAVQLADYCGLNPNYLSRLFKEEVGCGIGEYIRRVKVESAESMLRFSDDSYLTIANNLSFSSQSHFVKVFREHTNMTPKEYRNRYYRKGFEETDV